MISSLATWARSHLRDHGLRKTIAAVSLFLVSLGGVIGTASTAGASLKPRQTITINVGFPVANVNCLPIWYGQTSGLFAKDGFTVNAVALTSSTNVATALESGSITAGTMTTIALAQVYNQGAPLQAVTSFDEGLPAGFVVSNSYMASHGLTTKSTPQQVANALVGATLASSSTSITGQMYVIMRAYGIQPSQYKVVSVGNSSAEMTSLATGAAQFTFANDPTPFIAVQNGYGTILMTAKNSPVIATKQYNQMVVVNSNWAASHVSETKHLVKALWTAVHYVGAHHQQMVSLLNSETPGYTRPNLLKSIAASSWSTTPLQSEGLWRASIAFDIKSGQLKPGATQVKEGGIWTNKYAPAVS